MMAAKFNVKLVFYGENQAEYGNNADENYIPTMIGSFFQLMILWILCLVANSRHYQRNRL